MLHVVDDDRFPLREWLPAAARIAAGPFGVAFMTEVRGTENRRAPAPAMGARPSQLAREDLRGALTRPAHAA
jgi:hypothetical protein